MNAPQTKPAKRQTYKPKQRIARPELAFMSR
jgi:hypothetical protein